MARARKASQLIQAQIACNEGHQEGQLAYSEAQIAYSQIHQEGQLAYLGLDSMQLQLPRWLGQLIQRLRQYVQSQEGQTSLFRGLDSIQLDPPGRLASIFRLRQYIAIATKMARLAYSEAQIVCVEPGRLGQLIQMLRQHDARATRKASQLIQA